LTVLRRTLSIDRGDSGRRLDVVLRRHLADIRAATRTRVQRWIKTGHVAINGSPVRRVAARPAAGDQVSVDLAGLGIAQRARPAPENLPVDVLFEDDYLIAVDKPAGLVTHPAYKHPTGTLLNAVLWLARGWDRSQRPSFIGRLDQHTSGIVIAAKTAALHAALQRELRSSRAAKDYLAVVYGHVKPVRGSIDMPLGRDPRDRRRVVVDPGAGTPSVTAFERLAFVPAPPVGLSLLRCRLSTGRMHQIRVHLAARRTPIVGDPVYGEPHWVKIADPALSATLQRFSRQALHAHRVEFTHPITRAHLQIEAPIPEDLRALGDKVGFKGMKGC
jgi:23S rRNA pseudouridine1911/1915/1917 synthase